MRINPTYVASIIVPLLALSQAGPADAASRKKVRSHAHPHPYAKETRVHGNPMAANGYSGYHERVLERVPYGSQLWWRVYHSYPRN
jgi:hypothetical protein